MKNSHYLAVSWRDMQEEEKNRRERCGRWEKIFTVTAIALMLGLIAWNEYDDYVWAKEYQQVCDTKGC